MSEVFDSESNDLTTVFRPKVLQVSIKLRTILQRHERA
jgi:hypothetical protein